jgi:hypothetical protein
MEAEQLLTNLIGASPLLVSLAPFYYLLKGQITKGMASKDDLEKIIIALKHDFERELGEKEVYIMAVDKKAQNNAKSIARVEGRLESS